MVGRCQALGEGRPRAGWGGAGPTEPRAPRGAGAVGHDGVEGSTWEGGFGERRWEAAGNAAIRERVAH